MADGLYNEPRKWSLEEIDELLRDSGIVSDESESEKPEETVSQKKAESVDPRPTYNENAQNQNKKCRKIRRRQKNARIRHA